MLVSAGQIKAARALLGLTREALANATHLSAATIRNLEMGFLSYRSAEAVRQAFEAAGIEFLDNDGLRRKSDALTVLRGDDSSQQFYDDLIETLRGQDGRLAAVVPSEEALLDCLGAARHRKANTGADKVNKLLCHAEVRCLLTEEQGGLPSHQDIAYRVITKQAAGPMAYFIYGSKYALALPEYGGLYQYILFQTRDIAQAYQGHFDTLWKSAVPLLFERKRVAVR